MLRLMLSRLYTAGAYLAAAMMVLLVLLVLTQIVARNVGVLVETTEISGFSLAAITFLSLAYTLKQGDHIRVSLLIQGLGPVKRRLIELWCTGVALGIIAMLVVHTGVMVYESWSFQEVSPGLMAIPVWIPQLGMLIGVTLLAIALLDEFVLIASGKRPSYAVSSEEEVAELLEEAGVEDEPVVRPATMPFTRGEAV
ncbi:MAG TPA: TRAP transporter small permease [Candidatus Paenalcaligenes intestinipullorum]|uniref:TRAP transporter small permease protein n=1 Tax=Candidatus Paenalcaligenes intestinipullorum TaxID=2838718 RepID=A0A9D2U956_9BURK|nr:TRAP transporter small permease [Candidatus Paenalcaligenes intestinipullorum]